MVHHVSTQTHPAAERAAEVAVPAIPRATGVPSKDARPAATAKPLGLPLEDAPADRFGPLVPGAIVQFALGIEFTLSGLNKLADVSYVRDFSAFVSANPGATSGVLSGIVQGIVLPNATLFALLLQTTELLLGPILIVAAIDLAVRRRPARRGTAGSAFALVAVGAGLIAAALALSIYVLAGGELPSVMPGRAFTSPIEIELLIVPLGLGVAWLEGDRFRAARALDRRVHGMRR